ncbi:hypothetical protein ILUMI_14241 [Ignelater luminosus]|uniref:Uncharacterized protein n=1 Tax=Ignelater luminosus TaxID=2038154 RepID=A0A8K0CV67_IGNLU|nr:hypothetical protein ILUMI_14241 [Ignelater luminosus]
MAEYDSKRALTLKKLEAIVEELDLNAEDSIDMAYIPPDVDNVTDEEEIDDNAVGEIDGLPNDLPGTFEILGPVDVDEIDINNQPEKHNGNISDDNDNEVINLVRKMTANVKWCKTSIDYNENRMDILSNESKHSKTISELVHGKSPIEFFKLFFDDDKQLKRTESESVP